MSAHPLQLTVFLGHCFNGAALVRARKYARRLPFAPRRESLQWGRARASAEIPNQSSHQQSAGTSFNGAALVRARKSACIRLMSASVNGFNGAALVRARKSPKTRGILGAWAASMGPRSCERGNHVANDAPLKLSFLASMGPRSCERGNAAIGVAIIGFIALLQWGRARASAEMSPER